MQRDVEPGRLHPLRHGLGRKAEPAMGMLVAQEFEIVRREVDHQQPAAGPQHARRLADRARAVVEEVQHLMDDDDVEGILRQREIVDVALPHAAMAQAGAVEPRARQRQHVERHVEAEPALDAAARTVPACARCRCRDRAASGTRCPASARADRLLDRLVGDMQLADAVPLGGVPAEIGLRRRGARRAHRGEPLAVAQQRGVGRIEPPDQLARQLGRRRRARPAGRTPRSPRGSARPGRPPPAAAGGARCAAATGAGSRSGPTRSARPRRAAPGCAAASPRPAALSAPLRVGKRKVGRRGHRVGSIP